MPFPAWSWWIAAWAMSRCLLGITSAPLTDTFDVRVYDQSDGLAYFAVLGLAATPDGGLWIATFRDLACYDGIGFRRMSSHDAPGFAGAKSQVLMCDRKGRL